MVPVEFHGNPAIASAFVALLDKFEDRRFLETGEALNRTYLNAQTAFVELIQKIAKDLKVDLSNYDVRGRVYAPVGWERDQSIVQGLREESLNVLSGNRPIKIEIYNPQDTSPST